MSATNSKNKIKISRVAPAIGIFGGLIMTILTGFQSVDFHLDPSHIWTFMGICLGSTVAYKAARFKWASGGYLD